MTQFFNNIEPNVIDDEILQKAIEEKCPEDLGDIARKESINVKVVTEIQFSFKNILQIANLWPFENLTKLQLDNNVIEKIEGLESLVHLVWLDLSFNNIEVIEGLDTLVKLQDLSLYNNRISTIEHMDTLQELQIFSIGKNNLTFLEDVSVPWLCKYSLLQTLNLSGNPFCSEEHYRLFVVAHLPNLVYLDFKLVRNSTGKAAALKYQHLTKPLEQEEAQVLALQEVEDAKQKELEHQQAAFVEYLNGPFLFDSLHEEDGEATKLVSLPGVEELLQAYKEEFVSLCESLYNYGLEEYEKREAEVSKFYKRFHEILAVKQEESKRIISDFESRNERRLDELYQDGSGEIADSKRAQGKEEIQQLWHALMILEALVSNDLEELLQDFKRSIDVIASTFTENIQGMFSQCRDLENQHFEKVMEIVQAILKKISLFQLEEDFPDDLRTLFEDKITVVNIISVSHSIRLRKIDKRESDMLSNTYQWQKSVREKAFQTESDRNRACIEKIICLTNTLQKELDSTAVVLKPKE
ncbi:dynein regulatory complex subunit 3 [Geospiza fortis]|uniref:Dynein regulatory complex subunit 3 n=1 Tax=Geospiza fortis TaxID=48883 RepID=A0A6I9HMQ9_GEOFO|nr:dynein regulatory complex subunit 3 [Geospiza fortis]